MFTFTPLRSIRSFCANSLLILFLSVNYCIANDFLIVNKVEQLDKIKDQLSRSKSFFPRFKLSDLNEASKRIKEGSTIVFYKSENEILGIGEIKPKDGGNGVELSTLETNTSKPRSGFGKDLLHEIVRSFVTLQKKWLYLNNNVSNMSQQEGARFYSSIVELEESVDVYTDFNEAHSLFFYSPKDAFTGEQVDKIMPFCITAFDSVKKILKIKQMMGKITNRIEVQTEK